MRTTEEAGGARRRSRTGRVATRPVPSDSGRELRHRRQRHLRHVCHRRARHYAERVSPPFGFLLAPEPPSRRVGVLVAVAAVALCTLIIYPLKQIAPVVSLSVVYLPAVLVISVTWGVWLGFATAMLSAARSTSSTFRRSGSSRSGTRATGWR